MSDKNYPGGEKPSYEHPVHLTAGETAPNFELESDEYKHYALADFKHQNIVLYFYPKAMSPDCTTEACDFRDNLERLSAAGYTVIGVSSDDMSDLQEFREKNNLTFTLLSDPHYKAHELYGAVKETMVDGKKEYECTRSTFVIDGNGKIVIAEYGVDAKGHVDRLLAELKKLEK
ncbi:peroxiredoxin [Bifidobacterium choloepi]|uniref:thioredoxin-dependent peroxiredoxin n=1 Tax=Bifidobacterium choloepi TaxID=2614131 RepID=A0A6I5NFP7_9BIFI|nr:peroxiredoxin [Bifidobacterium choloepi]NEG69183.1 peroxiredoxin [Bifidobacterium choloepi]